MKTTFTNKFFAVAAFVGAFVSGQQLAAEEAQPFNEKAFADVPVEFKAVPFWSWNEIMQPDEIKRQVNEIKRGGWGGAFVHSREGLITEYLSDDWFKGVSAAIDACVETGLKVWLYDEDGWPSGYSGGTVPAANEDYRQKSLVARKVGERVPKHCEPIGEPHDGIQVYKYIAPMGNARYNGATYIDTMNKAAVGKFITDAYESYYKRYSEYYGKVIVAEFTDEPSMSDRSATIGGGIAYSSNLVETFKNEYGFDPIPHFYKLFADTKGAESFRVKYYRTLNKMFEEAYPKQIADWCGQHNISLTGHFMQEFPLSGSQLAMGDVMPYYRHNQIPGIDHLLRQIGERPAAKQCQSVVNQFGKKRMLSEMYGIGGAALSFEDRKWVAVEQVLLGVNLINPHLSLYTMAGCRKRDYPQSIYYQQPWWGLNSTLDIPLARLCYAMAQGKYCAKVLVIHPMESVRAKFIQPCDNNAPVWDRAGTNKRYKAYEDGLNQVTDNLLANNIGFDYASEQIMAEDGSAGKGTISVGQSTYSIVVIPSSCTLRMSTVQMLEKFQKTGGLLLFAGNECPLMIDGEENPRIMELMKNVEKLEAFELSKRIIPVLEREVAIETKSGNKDLVWSHARDLSDGSRIILIANLDRNSTFEGVAKFGGVYNSIKELDIKTGKITEFFAERKSGSFVMPLNLQSVQTKLIMLSKDSPKAKKEKPETLVSQKELKVLAAGPNEWNSLTLDYAFYETNNAGESGEYAVPVIEIQNYLNQIRYNGKLTIRYPFKVKGLKKGLPMAAVIENPLRCSEIRVNGTPVKYEGADFWRDFRWLPVNITKEVVEGDNVLELEFDKFECGIRGLAKPAFKRYGTEIESVYIIGNFAVNAEATGENPFDKTLLKMGLPAPAVTRAKADSLYICDQKPVTEVCDITYKGYPFYTGAFTYLVKLGNVKPAANKRFAIALGKTDCAVVAIRVNDALAGVIYDAPYELDITKYVKTGNETVAVECYPTLRNLMGPHHNIIGEPRGAWPHSFQSHQMGDRRKSLKAWTTQNKVPGDWTDNYSLVSFGNVGKILLKTYEK